MNENLYNSKLEELFVRFPSVQNSGFGDAYKPGLDNMFRFNEILGRPDSSFKCIHVAGTNGKGSVSNMLAAALSSKGYRVGLYTSPHILDFRERMRIINARAEKAELITKEEVWDFICRYEADFDRLHLSFFEITTGMALRWFADRKVDFAIMEVGLGGRLDSTNIINSELSIITSIGLDHCALLGDTRAQIAGEKAGIFKHGTMALCGSYDNETAPVFKARANDCSAQLSFADRMEIPAQERIPMILKTMDLRGEYQNQNLRTVLAALSLMGEDCTEECISAIKHTAAIMDFHGRWEKISSHPDIICDIGHNPPALEKNFSQLKGYLSDGEYSDLTIVYGVMADKDLGSILPLMPENAHYILVAPSGARAMKAEVLYEKCATFWKENKRECSSLEMAESVAEGIVRAVQIAGEQEKPLIYIGGSTFVVSEASAVLQK